MNYAKLARRGINVILLTLIVLFLFSCSLLAGAFSVSPSAVPTLPFTAKEFLPSGIKYHNLKTPSGVVTDEVIIGGATVLYTFIADEEGGNVYGFYGSKEFVISSLSAPTRLRILDNRYLLALDSGDVHIFDLTLSSGNMPYGYLGVILFSDFSPSIKDFVINSSNMYVISENNELIAFLFNREDFSCKNSVDIVLQGLDGGEKLVALDFFEDLVYVLCQSSYVKFNAANAVTTQRRYRPSLDNPKDLAIVEVKASGSDLVLIAQNGGISGYVNGSRVSTKQHRASSDTAIKSGEIILVNAISYKNNKLYTSDISDHARCVMRFGVNRTDGSLIYDNLFIGSKGSDDGRLYEPSSIASLEGKTYIADTKNRRIQIWDNSTVNVMHMIDMSAVVVNGLSMEYDPVALTVLMTKANEVLIFVATANGTILAMDEVGTVVNHYSDAGGQFFNSITSLKTDGENVYALDSSMRCIYRLEVNEPRTDGNKFYVQISGLTSPTDISIGSDFRVYVADKTPQSNPVIKIFDQSGGTEANTIHFDFALTFSEVTAITVDDRGTIYFFATESGASRLNRLLLELNESGESYYSFTRFTHTSAELKNIKSIAICSKTGDFFVADTNNSMIRFIARSELGVLISDEAPSGLEPPVFIKNAGLNADSFHSIDYVHAAGSTHAFAEAAVVRTALVARQSTYIFKIEEQFEASDLYPTGYAIKGYPQLVNVGDSLIVLSSDEFNSTNGFAYVLYRGLAGFIKAENLDISARNTTDMPYKSINGFGLTLYNNVEVFKYPSLEKHTNGSYFYLLDTLTIDTQLTVICRVEDPINNSYFYEIKYAAESSDPNDRDTWQTAFVRRYHVSPDSERNSPERTAGKIKADVNKGIVIVHEEPNGAVSPDLTLRDNTRVTVKSEIGGWVEVEWTTAEGEIRRGFLEQKYVIYTGLTAMQVVGVIILILALATIVITVWLKKPKKQTQVQSEIMRF